MPCRSRNVASRLDEKFSLHAGRNEVAELARVQKTPEFWRIQLRQTPHSCPRKE